MKKENDFLSENEYLENLFSDMTSNQLANMPSDFAFQDDLVNTMFERSKKIINGMVEYRELMMMYTCAMKTIKTKFDVLDTEFNVRYQRNPIRLIDTRLKRTVSIVEKMERNGISFSVQNIENHINDVAGVRVICSYLDDIYVIAKALTEQQDITLISQKDYIAAPKDNGYRSMHLIVSVPVFFADRVKDIRVEVQIRTIAMDFWASLEHQLRYKKQETNDVVIAEELKECAQTIAGTDIRMLEIRKKMEKNNGAPTDDEVLLEKLKKFDISIE